MSISEALRKQLSPEFRDLDNPWDHRPPILSHIEARLDESGGRLRKGAETLPDDAEFLRKYGFPSGPGSLDGSLDHDAGPVVARDIAQRILEALKEVMLHPDQITINALCALSSDHTTLSYIHALFDLLADEGTVPAETLHELAVWLAINAPHREPVKLAMSLLGLFPGEKDLELLCTLGLHDEFTLFAASALAKKLEQPQRHLWRLGQAVEGWGRVAVAQGLARTTDPEIKRWLVRSGCRNLLPHHTAYACATGGDLAAQLDVPEPDDELLAAAGEILHCLVTIGPGKEQRGIDDYQDGARAIELYLTHLTRREPSLEEFLTARRILDFVMRDDGRWHERAGRGWTEARRRNVWRLCDDLVERPDWPERVRRGLDSADEGEFRSAAHAALHFGIDTWEAFFQRLQSGGSTALRHLHHVMDTDDPERIDRVIAYALATLPLDDAAAGPAGANLGENLAPAALDFILSKLHRFPGHGWPLIRVGLLSPVMGTRTAALRALAEWPREERPADAVLILEDQLAREPRTDVRQTISQLLGDER